MGIKADGHPPARTKFPKIITLGVNSFITKPVSFNDLLKVIKTLGRYWLEIVELSTVAPRR